MYQLLLIATTEWSVEQKLMCPDLILSPAMSAFYSRLVQQSKIIPRAVYWTN